MLSRTYLAKDDDSRTGAGLSGGQWQRVALARGFMREQVGLLILDEPSSGLDPQAEYELHESLRGLRAGRTSLLISHRLNTVCGADHIVVLDHGRITEQGTHAALVASGGQYARLFATQATGYRDRPAAAAGLMADARGSR